MAPMGTVPPPEVLAGADVPRTAEAFDVELVAGILHQAGAVDEGTRRDILVRQRAQRARILKAHGAGPRGTRYTVSPVELIASLELPDARREGDLLDQDRITELVGQALHFPTRKIDPLKLDMQLITRAMSRSFARSHGCLPLTQVDGVVELAVANPWDQMLFENLRHVIQAEIRPVFCAKADILQGITDVYGFKTSVNAAMNESVVDVSSQVGNLEQLVHLSDQQSLEANDRPVVNAVEYLLHYAFDQRASDVHVEPKREHTMVRMRIDGVLHDVYKVPRGVHAPIVARLKILARMDVAEKRRPQDGRIKTRRGDREVELRVSTVPVAFGEKVVLRVFDPEILLQDLSELGFYEEERSRFESWIARPHGMVLVTGPTGSGKTTTLYSALLALTRPDVNVVTLEDPVELVHEAFNQISIQPGIGLGFAEALRHVLRQDPDIVMVGEIRDGETARYAVQAALTGHLVLSTLHTNDAASAVVRLRDLGVPPFLLSSTLLGTMAQRLVRRICPRCAEPEPLTIDQLAALGVAHPEDYAGKIPARVGRGCNKCRGTGYFGRTGIFELLDVSPKNPHGHRRRRRRPGPLRRRPGRRDAHPPGARPAQARRRGDLLRRDLPGPPWRWDEPRPDHPGAAAPVAGPVALRPPGDRGGGPGRAGGRGGGSVSGGAGLQLDGHRGARRPG